MGLSYNTIYHCEKCNDRGFVYKTQKYPFGDYDYDVAVKCECHIIRKNLINLEKSGLKEAVQKLTFETFETKDDFQKVMMDRAKKFTEQNNIPFFYIGGQVGSGKTHICTAMCGRYLQQKSKR